MERENNGDINCSWCDWNSLQSLGKEIRGIENRRKNQCYTGHSIRKDQQEYSEESQRPEKT